MPDKEQDSKWMQAAIELAARGLGRAAPNPMVGCVLVRNGERVAAGWHNACGEAHAEAMALAEAGENARGTTAYVSLEPCCHHGRTPPCSDALIKAGVRRVVVANADPFEKVGGRGLEQLAEAGIEVTTGVLEAEARTLNRAYFKRIETGLPWVIAKWAMTLDGRIATEQGDSKWISCPSSREIVHRIRGYVDAVVVGIGTALADDPMLNHRLEEPPPRIASRIVIDSRARLPVDSRLVKSATRSPVIICCGPDAARDKMNRLIDSGVEVLQAELEDSNERIMWLLRELGQRDMTRLLVEGGGQLLGAFNDLRQIDEVHSFIGPRLIGGRAAVAPVKGEGSSLIADGTSFDIRHVERIEQDVYLWGIVNHRSAGIRNGPTDR
ncbi:MAG: bifunctional diaminohydroxyphosphoribosylaminopyrimidine deaminase/5-amino-6-(5-phosphoribosylamino)uracil reductase RibD [Planctomycetota bacterium]